VTTLAPIDRRRGPPVSNAALELFAKLERLRRGRYAVEVYARRDVPGYAEGSRELCKMLDLSGPWLCSITSPLDRSREPPLPKGGGAEADWREVRAVREQMLTMAHERGLLPGGDRGTRRRPSARA
jgi:hypothetical protein